MLSKNGERYSVKASEKNDRAKGVHRVPICDGVGVSRFATPQNGGVVVCGSSNRV